MAVFAFLCVHYTVSNSMVLLTEMDKYLKMFTTEEAESSLNLISINK